MNSDTIGQRIESSLDSILELIGEFRPDTGLILGSGLGEIIEDMNVHVRIPYSSIMGFPQSTIKGHKGNLLFGDWRGRKMLIMQGRFHYYEGYSFGELAIPIRVFKKLGMKELILTNAAGAINEKLEVGSLMQITDHINFTFGNPLMGKNIAEYGPRFLDTSGVYDTSLISALKEIAQKNDIPLFQGVYQFMTGPSYETPAEVRMAKTLGADALGMSTFPEALVAHHCGIKVMGISYISNLAAGISEGKLDHSEVIKNVEAVKGSLQILLSEIIKYVSKKS